MPEAEPESAEGGFAPLANVYSLPEAQVLLTTLSAYGISGFAFNGGTISTMPDMMIALGGVTIFVPPQQLQDAIDLLEEIDGGWEVPPSPVDPNPIVSGTAAIAMTAFGGAPMPRMRGEYRWSPRGRRSR